MLAIRQTDPLPTLTLRSAHEKPARGSIGAKRNPASTRAILDAAAVILARDGLAGFSMDAIARLAQCGKPTLYRWWPDKASLLADLHERAMVPSGNESGATSLDERIQGLVDHWVHLWHTTQAGIALRGMVAEAQHSAAAHAVLHGRGLAPYRAGLTAVLTEQTDGDSPTEADVQALLRETLFPMLGELMMDVTGPAGVRPASRRLPVMRTIPPRAIAAPLPPLREQEQTPRADPNSQTVRHRGEWVD